MSGTLGNIDMLPSSNTMHLRIIDMHKFTVYGLSIHVDKNP